MKFPVIIIPNSAPLFPLLATNPCSILLNNPILLTSYGENMRKALFYSTDGLFNINEVTSCRKASLWNLLVHRNDPDFWDLKISYSKLGLFDISVLVSKIEDSIEEMPYDVWMQYHEKQVILHLLRECKNIAEVMAVGCLIGVWEADIENKANLPELHDNSDEYDPETISETQYIMNERYSGKLSRTSIQQIADHIHFYD